MKTYDRCPKCQSNNIGPENNSMLPNRGECRLCLFKWDMETGEESSRGTPIHRNRYKEKVVNCPFCWDFDIYYSEKEYTSYGGGSITDIWGHCRNCGYAWDAYHMAERSAGNSAKKEKIPRMCKNPMCCTFMFKGITFTFDFPGASEEDVPENKAACETALRIIKHAPDTCITKELDREFLERVTPELVEHITPAVQLMYRQIEPEPDRGPQPLPKSDVPEDILIELIEAHGTKDTDVIAKALLRAEWYLRKTDFTALADEIVWVMRIIPLDMRKHYIGDPDYTPNVIVECYNDFFFDILYAFIPVQKRCMAAAYALARVRDIFGGNGYRKIADKIHEVLLGATWADEIARQR